MEPKVIERQSFRAVVIALGVGAGIGLAVALVVTRGVLDVYRSYELGQLQRDRAYAQVLSLARVEAMADHIEQERARLAQEVELATERHIAAQSMRFEVPKKQKVR